MLNYTNSIKSTVDESVYNAGLKLYLDGRVNYIQPLMLDNWRLYTVSDTHESYSIAMPILHLTMEQKHFSKAAQALEEVVTCRCQYFAGYGLCKHVVAIMASLDKEFNNHSQDAVSSGVLQEDFLDSIFEAEQVKTHRKWLEIMDNLLHNSQRNFYQLDKISKTIKEEPGQHKDYFIRLAQLIEPLIGRYAKEKRLLRIALESILIGKQELWDFYQPLLSRVDVDLQIQFWLGIWKFYWLGTCEGFEHEVVGSLSMLPVDMKQSILHQLLLEYETQSEVYIEFCFQCRHYEYILDIRSQLSEEQLIRLTELVPDIHEETELQLSGHVKTWSDFLKAGEYTDFLDIINLWAVKLGKSELFVDTVKYCICSHPKKKSLLSKLKNLV